MGGGVCHSANLMLTYHSGALDGSAAYVATRSRGRSISISVSTSAVTIVSRLRKSITNPLMRMGRSRRRSPRLARTCLHVGLQAAQEMLPALDHRVRRRILPATVLEGNHDRAARFLDSPTERRSDPARHVVSGAGPAH